MFPKNFIWGSSTAAYQVEGAYDADGKGKSIWDVYSHLPGTTYMNSNGDVAADHYHRYKEDVALMAEMGLKSYRFSISWPRIFPNGVGDVNLAGIEFYDHLINELLKYNIEPMITLYHWDLPQYLQEHFGGWESRKTIDAFDEYAKTCFSAFGDRVKLWTTFNEPVIFLGLGYVVGVHPPKLHDTARGLQACHNMFLANAKAVKAFKEMKVNGQIGFINVLQPNDPVSNDKADIEACELAEKILTDWFFDPVIKGTYQQELLSLCLDKFSSPKIEPGDLDLIKENTVDFIGVNYYKREMVAANFSDNEFHVNNTGKKGSSKEFGFKGLFKFVKNPNGIYSDWDWEIYPEGLTDALVRLHKRYPNFPIYITENGLGAKDPIVDGEVLDQPRIDYLSAHIQAAKSAIEQGVNLKSYYTWSFIDLLSWLNGYQKQYGFVYIDVENNLKRVKKKSFNWYKNIIKTNGECSSS